MILAFAFPLTKETLQLLIAVGEKDLPGETLAIELLLQLVLLRPHDHRGPGESHTLLQRPSPAVVGPALERLLRSRGRNGTGLFRDVASVWQRWAYSWTKGSKSCNGLMVNEC